MCFLQRQKANPDTPSMRKNRVHQNLLHGAAMTIFYPSCWEDQRTCTSFLAGSFPKLPQTHQLLSMFATSFPLGLVEHLNVYPSLLTVWGLHLPSAPNLFLLPSHCILGGLFLLFWTPWHSLNPRGRKKEGGGRRERPLQGVMALTLRLWVWGGLCQAGAQKAPAGSESIHRLAGLSLPSPCLLPNESSHTTLELEGEGHSFIYITQEISQSTSINHDHYPKSYKITLLTASAARGLYFSPFLFLLGKKTGENDKIIRSNLGAPQIKHV